MFDDYKSYAIFLYTLQNQYGEILKSKIHFFTVSQTRSIAYGTFYFKNQIELRFREEIDFLRAKLLDYYYEARQYDEKKYSYDPQPHPENPDLASTYPHHKHAHPDIKHNRQPAPGISFDKPNLPFLIKEIIENIF